MPDDLRDVRPASVGWRRDGAELFYCQGDGRLCRHRVGAPQSADELLYHRPDRPRWHYLARVTADDRFLVATVLSGSDAANGLLVWDLAEVAAKPVALGGCFDAILDPVGNEGRRFWLRYEDGGCPNGRIVIVDLDAPLRERWRTVIEQAADPLREAWRIGDRLIADYLRDCCSRLAAFGMDGRPLGEVPLPGDGTVLAVAPGAGPDDLSVEYTDSLTPPAGAGLPRERYATRQVVCRGRDGTRVSVFLSHRRDLPRDGRAPTYLTGYGGFGRALTPSFSPEAAVWMEMGGVHAVVNARGGGEYGRLWHQAAIGRHKQRSFDDCLAAAEWLIADGYTQPERLAVGGSSNGGLMAAACLTQRPELFAAAVVDSAPLDMLRYDRLGIGEQWLCEYGSPGDPDERAALAAYSPVHNVRPGVRYPTTLITTAAQDPLVHPAHSHAFAGRLRAASVGSVELRIYDGAEHAPCPGSEAWLDRATDRLVFLADALGVGTA